MSEQTHGAGSFGGEVAAYYCALIDGGVSDDAALTLTRDYIMILLGPSTGWAASTINVYEASGVSQTDIATMVMNEFARAAQQHRRAMYVDTGTLGV